jgi:Lrp/AsnC family transcriptional regulator for asnA, asnC and gidA
MEDETLSSAATGDSRSSAARASRGAGAFRDPIDGRLIEELQEDGRRSYATLAKAVGLSEAAVRQRVHRLVEAGVMQIVAVTDPLTLGFARQAMVGIRTEGDVRGVAEKLSAITESHYVVICAGSFDILVELVCEDDDHLLSVVNDSIRSISGVRDTETFVYLKLGKQTYTWGTP